MYHATVMPVKGKGMCHHVPTGKSLSRCKSRATALCRRLVEPGPYLVTVYGEGKLLSSEIV